MKSKGRIALVIPHIASSLDNDLIGGIFSYCSRYGYDVIVLTGIFNAKMDHFSNGYSDGLENIYTLLRYIKLDGVIFAAGRFSSDTVRKRIFSILKSRFIPCIVLEHECDEYPYIFPPQREYMKLITKHLIREHNCKKLYCITGMNDNYASLERLAGFTEAMDEEGLEYDDNCIFYGYFRKDVPKRIGLEIADGSIPLPDGIVCANNAMAAALCSSLIEQGVNVPDDIAVAGYDGSWEAFVHEPPITTIAGHERQLGLSAAKMLLEQIVHKKLSDTQTEQYIRFDTSCGCSPASTMYHLSGDKNLRLHLRKTFEIYAERRNYITSDIIGRMSACGTIGELIDEANKLGYMLLNWEWLEICLCSDWLFDLDSPDKFRTDGYSEKMLLALSKRRCPNEEAMYEFPIRQIFPALEKPHETAIFVLTSLHYKSQIFGYMCTSYNNSEDILLDEYYVSWCDALANGINIIQEKLYREHIRQKFESLSTIDPATGLYNRRGLMENLASFAAGDERLAVIVLSYSDGKNDHYEVQPVSVIANALRNTDEKHILAVPAENLIAYVSADNSGKNETDTIERFTKKLSRRVREYYNGAAQIKIDKLAAVCRYTDLNHITEFEALFDEMAAIAENKALALASHTEDYREQIRKLRIRFINEPQLDWNIEAISKEIGISRSHLQRLYKEQYGRSCIDDIINSRIEKAKWLLVNTDMRIGQIAEQCGYTNETHFMRQFKDRAGITALSYRKLQKDSGSL